MATSVELGTRFRNILSQIAQQAVVLSGVTSIKLPKTFLHRAITFRLRGSLDVSVASMTSVKAEAPLGLIQKIELLGDGRKVYWAISGRDAYRLSQLMMGKGGELSPPVLTVGNNPFAATFQVHHEAVGMRMPPDSFFDPRMHEEVELRITWGAISDIAVVGGATVALNASSYVDLILEQTAEGAEAIQFNRLLSYREFTVAATDPQYTYEISRNGLLIGILFRTDRDGTPVNNIINKVTLKSDSSFIHADGLRWDTLQGKNTIEHHLDRPQSALGATGYSATYAPNDYADNIEGYAFLPIVEDGMLSSALNTLALNTLEVILDLTKTSGTEVVRSTFVFYEPRDSA